MFYVSISATAIEKIKEHANKNPDKEVIGLLIGRMEGNTLIVEDSVTGEIVSERTRALIVPETIAKIADEIVSGKIKGNVVGWYHSHPGFGVFMSEIDIKTQMKMQQFSPYIVALIIDPTKDEMGLFTLDMNTRMPVTLTEDFIHIYAPGEEPVPPKFVQPSPPQFFYSPTYPFVTKPPVEKAKKRLNRRIMLILATLIPMLCLALFGIFIYTSSRYTPVRAELPPILNNNVSYGDEIPFSAKIFGGSPPYNCTWYVNGVLRKHEIINQTGGVSTFEYKANAVGNVSIFFSVTDKRTNSSEKISFVVIPNADITLLIEQDQYPWGEITIKGLLKGIVNGKFIGLERKNITLRFKVEGKEDEYRTITDSSGHFNYVWKDTPKKEVAVNVTAEFSGDINFSRCVVWKIINITRRETTITLNTDSHSKLVGYLIDKVTGDGISKANITITYKNETSQEWMHLGKNMTSIGGNFVYNLSKLKPANYTIKAEFGGDNNYNGTFGEIRIYHSFNVQEVKILNDSYTLTPGQRIFILLKVLNDGFFVDDFNISLTCWHLKLIPSPHYDANITIRNLTLQMMAHTHYLIIIEWVVPSDMPIGDYDIICSVNSLSTGISKHYRIGITVK